MMRAPVVPKITVYPARPGMKLAHPFAGTLSDEGSYWPEDTFTRRRIEDGGVFLERQFEIAVEAAPEGEPPAESDPAE